MEEQTNNITHQALSGIRDVISVDMIGKAFVDAKRLDRWAVLSLKVSQWFIKNDAMDDHLVDIGNRLKNEKNIEGAMNSMAIRMNLKRELVNHIFDVQRKTSSPSIYGLEFAKLVLSAFIIDALGASGIVPVDVRTGKYKDKISGKIKTYTSNWYLFQEYKEVMFDAETGFPRGLSDEPNVLGSSKLNVFPWERPVKFNKDQKNFLRENASMGFRLIRHNRTWWLKMFMESAWYKRSLEKKMESRASLKDRVEELVDGIMRLQEHDTLYIQWGFQISLRLQSQLNVEGIDPQGSGKFAWESAEPMLVTERMQREAYVDSTKLWLEAVRKELKPTTTRAVNIWRRNKAKILNWLIDNDNGVKMTMQSYMHGLFEVINKDIGDYTHRFVGRDLTTNGMAIFASNYGDRPMAIHANIAGLDSVGDSHQVMADIFGHVSRKAMKDTGISAGLFHGQGTKNIARQGGLELRDLIKGLDDSFGGRWKYFNQIASHIGHNLITNMNTSTRMRAPDGWFGINQSYVKKSQVEVTFFSMETGTNLRTVTVLRDMPIFFNGGSKIGNIVYRDPDGNKSNNGGIKMSGAYANSIHMLDAWMLRMVLRYLWKKGYILHHVHDNFFCNGEALAYVAEIIRRCHLVFLKENRLEMAINYMIDASGRKDIPHIKLLKGDLTEAEIKNSREFLQP